MRKSPTLLAPLFTPTMQGVLASLILTPDQEWYLSDLAAHLKVRPSTLQRVMASLTRAGILRRRKHGNRVYYQADATCPIFHELSAILTKTVGIANPIREALAPFDKRISLAFIHGSIAEGRERPESDIDLIIIGDAASADLALALRPMQEQLSRPVNFTRYTEEEFASKVRGRHPFVAAVLNKPRIFLIGGEDDLGKIAGGTTRRS